MHKWQDNLDVSVHGRVVADIALKMNRWKQIVFLDDDESIIFSMGIDVIGKSSDTYTYISEYDIFVAIVNNKKREKIQGQLETVGAKIATLKCP
jgi:predicted HAD superfamily phosphohydrolase YqeG